MAFKINDTRNQIKKVIFLMYNYFKSLANPNDEVLKKIF